MSGKGDKRRPGKIPPGEWERIFGKPKAKRTTKPAPRQCKCGQYMCRGDC